MTLRWNSNQPVSGGRDSANGRRGHECRPGLPAAVSVAASANMSDVADGSVVNSELFVKENTTGVLRLRVHSISNRANV